ncbi:purine-nucleoside phosphorylase [Terrilactibacillus sp. BCM23-1]|uniref:Purine nucleoside phosphorylase n=1 Tax=Terrilactibacillus tamarindi TaxID=2599694 RepID=A0A6N8CPY0_9BACI|nr:purine-nucleoside phosphorylase [Terrilactibacillus tamarindi]MTT31217.1 purine-nucleoside phosphorylase [Terrilactibacillus tamarindi]
MLSTINEAASIVQEKMTVNPKIGLILGSGLGILADELTESVHIPYESLPGFPTSTVKGHKGQFVIGKLEGIPVIAMQGRYHYYEGYDLKQVTLPVRVMKEIGITTLIVTNAAGGVNLSFKPGDLMIINDHINMLGNNPLFGPNDDTLGDRFPDMSKPYHPALIEAAKQAANDIGLSIQEGVYFATPGPNYETPAEVRMIRTLGGDAVGMSTVPEVIVANHAKLSVLGISCITNAGSGILDQPLSHQEVIEITEQIKDQFVKLIKGIVKKIG